MNFFMDMIIRVRMEGGWETRTMNLFFHLLFIYIDYIHEERSGPYVFLEVLTKMKVVRHLIRPPMIFFPGYNAQGLTSYSQKSK